MGKFIIIDWISNVLFNGEEFETADDAWEYIYEKFPNEENFDEYYVTEKTGE